MVRKTRSGIYAHGWSEPAEPAPMSSPTTAMTSQEPGSTRRNSPPERG
jgi:hypothetical protein